MSEETFKTQISMPFRVDVQKNVDRAACRFKSTPNARFLESVVDLLQKRLTLSEIIKYLDELHMRYTTFPYLNQVEANVKAIEDARPRKFYQSSEPPAWVSHQAPGTPPRAEAMFKLIVRDRMQSASFRLARDSFAHLSDDDIWAAYEMWREGKVHDKLKKPTK